VLVYDFVPVPVAFERAIRWAHDVQPESLSAAAADAFQCPQESGHVAQRMLRSRHDALVIDLHWIGDTSRARFEHFDGELQLAPLSGDRSHVSISATYAPTGGDALTSAERIRNHRETEARIRQFLTAVAVLLEESDG
jgi:hypothetical protein